MGRFDKNLNVTSANIPFFPNLACVSSILKGWERGFWAREKHGGHVRKEEGARSYPPFSLARGVSRLNSLPSPFERLPRRLAIIKLSYYHIFIFPANCCTILLGEILILKILIRF